MEPDLVAFTSCSPGDPDGSKLAAMLGAQLAWQLARSRRSQIAHVLATVSLPVWIVATWPDWPLPRARAVVLSAWVLCVGGLVIAALSERGWRRKCARALTEIRWHPSDPGSQF